MEPEKNSDPQLVTPLNESGEKTKTTSSSLRVLTVVLAVVGVVLFVVLAVLGGYYYGQLSSQSTTVMPMSEQSIAEMDEFLSGDEILPPESNVTLREETVPTTTIVESIEDRVKRLMPTDSPYGYRYNSFVYHDNSNEYTVYVPLNLDPDTFVYINEDYVKDATKLYYRGQLVQGFDPTGCTADDISACDFDSWRDELDPYELQITWNDTPAEAPGVVLPEYCKTEGFLVGEVTNGPLAGESVYVQSEEVCGMWCGGYLRLEPTHFVSYGSSLLRVLEEGFTIPGVSDFPEEIAIPNSDLKLLTYGPTGFALPSDTMARWLFSDRQAGSIYDSGRGNYHSVREDHIRIEYELEFPFWSEDGRLLDITYLDGTKNTESYSLNGGYGEAFRIVDQEERIENRVVKVGSFNERNDVYGLVNSNDPLLQDLYNDRNTLASFMDGKNKYTYDEFISHRPLLFWQNPFGDWVKFLNSRYDTAAEKCKPVIYLYPEKTGDFQVYVEPNGGFTETIPEYDGGWQVTATPQSLITDKKTGLSYPYLYWEGVNTGIPKITEGWIVEMTNIEVFLQEKLHLLGMNEYEIADFNEYWLDRFASEGASAYKIMFLPQHQFDLLSPLTVTGDEQPENVIRVMMYAQPAVAGETLSPQLLLETPERTGFTVVEWGGALLN